MNAPADNVPTAVQPSPQQGQVPATPATIPIEVGGVKYEVPKALEANLLMQADYTRKTQALADEKRAFESHQDQVIADALTEIARANPGKSLEELVFGQQAKGPAGQAPAAQPEPIPTQLVQRVEAVETRLQEGDIKAQEREIEATLPVLRAHHPVLSDNAVVTAFGGTEKIDEMIMNEALYGGIDLDQAAANVAQRFESLRTAQASDYFRSKLQQMREGNVRIAAQAPAPPAPRRPRSWAEAEESARMRSSE